MCQDPRWIFSSFFSSLHVSELVPSESDFLCSDAFFYFRNNFLDTVRRPSNKDLVQLLVPIQSIAEDPQSDPIIQIFYLAKFYREPLQILLEAFSQSLINVYQVRDCLVLLPIVYELWNQTFTQLIKAGDRVWFQLVEPCDCHSRQNP